LHSASFFRTGLAIATKKCNKIYRTTQWRRENE
jgi:hypothetical protein